MAKSQRKSKNGYIYMLMNQDYLLTVTNEDEMAAGPKSITRQPRFVSHKERETNAERLRKMHK